jgi:hypothetical protein
MQSEGRRSAFPRVSDRAETPILGTDDRSGRRHFADAVKVAEENGQVLGFSVRFHEIEMEGRNACAFFPGGTVAFINEGATLAPLGHAGRSGLGDRSKRPVSTLPRPAVDLDRQFVAVFAGIAVLEIGAGVLAGKLVDEGEIFVEFEFDDFAADFDIPLALREVME